MGKDPAVLFYTSDFLAGTQFFTDEQCGQYIRLLCQQHQLGHIPDQHMLNICKTHDSPIFAKFTKDKTGNWFNERMDLEKKKRATYCESRRSNKMKQYIKKPKDKHMSEHMSLHMDNGNENRDINVIKDVIEDLNSVLNTKFRYSSNKTKELIMSRLKEGFSLEDFKTVHRKKFKEWQSDEKMVKFLRPETLYSNKFEGYLQQKEAKGGQKRVEVG